ncbi:hypothetical protein KY290_005570 [Solanum tuberosum]|uniref:Retrotransposon gag domain-containing protein n=1 Tax=Solanum tuberosum TaxID=4113 RepID=A0ABQ7WGC6_SOLTU|nr:hypothetical protein KY289_005950 [Solanum tuberosum]KAH0779143.1 hypothetical protein KY290_005570 [Solanum tuberosum]
MSYMQGQDLWKVVNGSEVTQPEAEDANGTLRKWKIKAGKAMLALKTTIDEDVLEHVRDAKTPKEACRDTLAALFSKKNDARLQLLESELLSTKQRNMTIAQYFHKVKRICHEISNLNSTTPIGETRGWPNQPSLVEFKNLLAGQEAMAKQMAGLSIKNEEEAIYTNKSRNIKQAACGFKKKHFQGDENFRSRGVSKNQKNDRRFEGTVTIVGTRVIWKKIVGSRNSPSKVTQLPQIPTRKVKMFGMLKIFRYKKRRI